MNCASAAASAPVCGGATVRRVNRNDLFYLWVFVLANLLVKCLLLGTNGGEYTDGILQLTVFEIPSRLYPPLYGALAWLVRWCVTDWELAGRVVSAVSGSLALIPVFLMAQWLYDRHAARFAAVFFTISPLVIRWSLRVMTDGLFLLLSSLSMLFLLMPFVADRKAADCRKRDDRLLALAVVFAALSSLTRYQGVLLVPLLLGVGVAFVYRHRATPWRALLASPVWLLLPAWILSQGFAHTQQFRERTTGEWISTLLAYVNLFESFLLIAPYYFSYPVFGFFLVGLTRLDWRAGRVRAFLLLWALWMGGLLVIQSVFGSFQYRYMLPLLPACLVCAGVGCAWLEERLMQSGRRLLFSSVFIASVIYMTFFSCALIVLQRQTFADQHAAARYVREKAPPSAQVFSNELYGEFVDLGSVKLSFWSGRKVGLLFDYLPQKPGHPPPRHLPPGSILVLGNHYGGDEALESILSQLTFFYHMREVASFSGMVYPLHDDVMSRPMLNQNPMGWVFRYAAQLFSTHVFVVETPRTQAEIDSMLDRSLLPPGTRAIRDGSGRLTVARDHLTSRPDPGSARR